MSNFFSALCALGERVESRWRKVDYRGSTLPTVAARELEKLLTAHVFSLAEIACALTGKETLPPQLDLDSSFGEPPVTAWRSERLVVDVYFWFDGVPSIHEHAFTGAFGVLSGSSIHREASFHEESAISAHLRIGSLELGVPEVLAVGDVREIRSGARGAHTLFHIDRPSVSVVVRSVRDPEARIQYTYLPPTVAFNPRCALPSLTRKLDVLRATFGGEFRNSLGPTLVAFTDRSELTTTETFAAVHHCLLDFGFDELQEATAALFPGASERASSLRAALLQEWQVRAALRARSTMREQHARRVLAGLICGASRAEVCSLVRELVGARDPVAEVLRCLRAHATDDANALGLRLDEAAWAVLEAALRNGSEEGMLNHLARSFDGCSVSAQRHAIRTLTAQFASSPLLGRALAKQSSDRNGDAAATDSLVPNPCARLEVVQDDERSPRKFRIITPRPGRFLATREVCFDREPELWNALDRLAVQGLPLSTDGPVEAELVRARLLIGEDEAARAPAPAAVEEEASSSVPLTAMPLALARKLDSIMAERRHDRSAAPVPFAWARFAGSGVALPLDPDRRIAETPPSVSSSRGPARGTHSFRWARLPNVFPQALCRTTERYLRDLLRLGWMKRVRYPASRAVVHNDPFLSALHLSLLDLVEEWVGLAKPSYSLGCVYFAGTELLPHTDREQCEWTLSVMLEDAPNWPFLLQDEGLHRVDLAAGDGVLFAGRVIPHARPLLEGRETVSCAFFHFVPRVFSGSLD